VFLPAGTDGRTTAIGLEYYRGILLVAGGATGEVWLYGAYSGRLLARLDTGVRGGFINDVAVARGGAYFTDSRQPYIYRVFRAHGTWRVERWLDYSTTVIPFAAGFNLNGIAASRSGRYLFTIHSPTGRLFRIDTLTRAVREVDLGGRTLTAGDGLEARGSSCTSYATRSVPSPASC
jgi:sugar lactone lactonase YvrE